MHRKEIAGKIAVVTGATGGIGEAAAKLLAQQGARIVLTGRSETKLQTSAERIGGSVDTYVMDVASTEQVFTVMERIREKHQGIDILINNAGYGLFEAFERASLDDFANMMDVNYMGTVRCTKAVLPGMLQAGSGHIVNIASMAGKIGTAKSSGYSATKHAVLGFTNCLRQELTGTGIRLSAVNPGPVDTPFFERADPTGNYVKNVEWFMLKPEQVASAIMKAIVAGRAEIDLPWTAAAGVKLYQLFPRLLDRISYKLLNKK